LSKEASVEQRKRVYAWEFPVRFTHWINALAVLVLSATGVYIGRPFIHAVDTGQYVMGAVRFIHFVAGYTLLMGIAVRLYWAFMGNRYASWRAFFPFTHRGARDALDAVKYYLFISRKPPYAVGHTALGGLHYLLTFLLFAFMVVSGFAMHSLSSQSAMAAALGGWLLGAMEIQSIRLYHHMGMYAVLYLAAIHVYMAWYADVAERNGVMGSIFGGYKFVTGKERE
jgi:Ni/Fe-hydrogenase 1 B-type cytochrome subunit